MGKLNELNWCGNVAFRNSTQKLKRSTLARLIQENDIQVIIDVRKYPDHRLRDLAPHVIFKRIPEGHTASILEIEKIVHGIRYSIINFDKVLVISYHGRNRAPCLAAMACEDREEVRKVLSNPRYLTNPFFRSLLE